ncbi:coiled-coil domain-containing protein 103 [Vombatus ursinus]|uniref:Coiled-coil domain containing 103 n=1 Tax=Vombatus ursinus TaxID=29139 RepID=A0A4X2KPP4_VOMUR|nr:coiled-coil domain-containing protein 103 [Vombatus ursinus]XP_027729148.1 coiled-coil domain-containing protein 103 [Vombatus ursinus]
MEKTDTIDFRALEKELQAALAADEKYRRENAAKFRAVEQKVASYEEFRDIVLASHLKPLARKDKMSVKKTVLWNCHVTSTTAQTGVTQEESTYISQRGDCQPETSSDFYRAWRHYLQSGAERYQALLQLGAPNLGHLFRVDVGFGLLGELLMTLAENFKPADRAAVLEILHSLSKTGRFGLNLSLLSNAERESCQKLFQKLQSMDVTRPTEEELSCKGQELEKKHSGNDGDEKLLQELSELYQIGQRCYLSQNKQQT